jgi:polyisoprenoid-binding protein YceI
MASTQTQPVGTIIEPGTWVIDPAHSTVEFEARHLMVTKVRGRFGAVDGTIDIAADPLQSSVRAVIEAASVDSGDAKRDEHLRSPDFFDVEQYPTIDFQSKSVAPRGADNYEVVGDLTVHGITRQVTLDLEYHGEVIDPWGAKRAGFSAQTTVNRKDWGLEWNVALETGGFLVSDKVRLILEVEAVKQEQ